MDLPPCAKLSTMEWSISTHNKRVSSSSTGRSKLLPFLLHRKALPPPSPDDDDTPDLFSDTPALGPLLLLTVLAAGTGHGSAMRMTPASIVTAAAAHRRSDRHRRRRGRPPAEEPDPASSLRQIYDVREGEEEVEVLAAVILAAHRASGSPLGRWRGGGVHWLRFWSLLQREESSETTYSASKALEIVALDIFAKNGWRSNNRLWF
uniref:Uncharacterized protein n=1 Tax=Setaria italica TaxID=4555 RepID=K4AMA9_SETIT